MGVRQAQALGARLAGETFDTLYCSDLKRAVQTAELVFPGRAPVFDTRLREIARGELEGLLGAELVGEQRDVYAAMRRDLFSVRPPGGENYRDLTARAAPWLESRIVTEIGQGRSGNTRRGHLRAFAPHRRREWRAELALYGE